MDLSKPTPLRLMVLSLTHLHNNISLGIFSFWFKIKSKAFLQHNVSHTNAMHDHGSYHNLIFQAIKVDKYFDYLIFNKVFPKITTF